MHGVGIGVRDSSKADCYAVWAFSDVHENPPCNHRTYKARWK